MSSFQPMLAETFDDSKGSVNLEGYFLSVKLDGVRATWVHNKLLSRGNHEYHAPEWFTRDFPKDHILDGELWSPKLTFAQISGIVRRKEPRDAEWKQITFCVFEMPDPELESIPFHERTKLLHDVVKRAKSPHLAYIEQIKVRDFEEANKIYQQLVAQGHEGVVLRAPDSKYVHKRSKDMLKWKPIHTAEAQIVGFNEGEGKHKGHLGTFRVKYKGKEFNLSGNMTDAFRRSFTFRNGRVVEKPTLPCQTVMFEYMTLSPSGVPRQPVFKGFRCKGE
jgi:DNA ligase-1